MSVLPDKVNFVIIRGATFRHEIILHQGDVASPVVDLTGCTASIVVKTRPGGETIYTFPVDDLDIDGVAGKITISISDEDTTTLPWRRGFYTLLVGFPNGDTNAYLYGSLSVRET